MCAPKSYIFSWFCLRCDYHLKINAREYSKTTDDTKRMSFNTIDISSWIKCKQNNNRIATFIRSASVRHSRHFFRQLFLYYSIIWPLRKPTSIIRLHSVHFSNISSSIEDVPLYYILKRVNIQMELKRQMSICRLPVLFFSHFKSISAGMNESMQSFSKHCFYRMRVSGIVRIFGFEQLFVFDTLKTYQF